MIKERSEIVLVKSSTISDICQGQVFSSGARAAEREQRRGRPLNVDAGFGGSSIRSSVPQSARGHTADAEGAVSVKPARTGAAFGAGARAAEPPDPERGESGMRGQTQRKKSSAPEKIRSGKQLSQPETAKAAERKLHAPGSISVHAIYAKAARLTKNRRFSTYFRGFSFNSACVKCTSFSYTFFRRISFGCARSSCYVISLYID